MTDSPLQPSVAALVSPEHPLWPWIRRLEPPTQSKAASELGISEGFLSSVLSRDKKFSPPEAKRVSGITGVPVLDLRPDLADILGSVQ